MKIAITIPSRGRPSGLLSVITALEHLSSGQHEVSYSIVTDEDDAATARHMRAWLDDGLLPAGVKWVPGQRTKVLSARFNDAFSANPADLYMGLCDDVLPLTQNWDLIAEAAAKVAPAFSWQELNDPKNFVYVAMTSKWAQATGRFHADYFPFWFADTWLKEVYELAFGAPAPVIEYLRLGGRRGATTGMRDLAFWFRVFAATRSERLEEAARVRNSYGVKTDEALVKRLLALYEDSDRRQLERVPQYEAGLGANKGEPSELYLQAKARAEKLLTVEEAFA